MIRRPLQLAGLSVCLILMSPATAWAYIDPGVGSYLYQLLIAGGLAGLYTVRRYSHFLKTFIAGRFGRSDKRKH